jgi:hypothetical protein
VLLRIQRQEARKNALAEEVKPKRLLVCREYWKEGNGTYQPVIQAKNALCFGGASMAAQKYGQRCVSEVWIAAGMPRLPSTRRNGTGNFSHAQADEESEEADLDK